MAIQDLRQALSRRTFIKKTAGTGAALSVAGARLPDVLEAAPIDGKKGDTFPDQRRRYRDSESGRTVVQLTNTPGFTTQTPYWTNRHVTRDSRYLAYLSGSRDSLGRGMRFNLFAMDLRTGESVQLTESANVVPHSPDISRDGREVFYFEGSNQCRAVNITTLEDREICRLEDRAHVSHALTVSSDDRWAVAHGVLAPPQGGYMYRPTSRRDALFMFATDGSGEWHYLIDGNTPLGHVAFSPTDPNRLMYSYHTQWSEVQRVWMINADGTGSHPMFVAYNGEAIGHDFWGDSGEYIYASLFGGRQPQGLWRSDLQGNMECVLAGASISHNGANPEEDRFIVDELYHETTKLWTSRKGDPTPEVLCQLAADWWIEPEQTGPDHPHPRFLPNGQGVTFSSDGEIYLVEM